MSDKIKDFWHHTQSQLAKNNIHPLTSWPLSGGGKKTYISSNLPTFFKILKKKRLL